MIEFIVGFFTGITASMGLGGGFILIIYLLNFTDISQLKAQGMNLLFFLPIALVSVILHSKNKLIEWRIIPVCAGFGLLGIGVGFLITKLIDEKILSYIFGVLIIIVGIKEVFHKNLANSNNNSSVKTQYFHQNDS